MPMSPRLLRPRASGATHPEALGWATRVTANGGTVSTNTLAAVSKFCADIQSAGIRDRFYRLNLICGDGLLSSLVPLYRGPVAFGTVFGNATDTNNGPFVSGDYAQSSGLTNNASKNLQTGLVASNLPQTDRHMAAWVNTSTFAQSGAVMGWDGFPTPGNSFSVVYVNSSTSLSFRVSTASTLTNLTVTAGQNHLLISGNGAQSSYINGAAGPTASLTAFTAPNNTFAVFAQNRGNAPGTPTENSRIAISNYSIGLAFTASQASAFYTALSAFQTSLGRT